MATPFFGQNARKYYDAGISVLPIIPKMKRPALSAWSTYCKQLVDEATLKEWLVGYRDYGIGVAAGEASGIVFIDIDTELEKELNVIEALLPPTPYYKTGKKGKTYAFKYDGHRAFKIKDTTGRMIVECLSTGNQTVIQGHHPDGMDYVESVPLWQVKGSLPPLPRQIEEMLRGSLRETGAKLSLVGSTRVTTWTASGSRDVKMIAVAGAFARGVLRGEMSLKRARLELEGWFEGFTEKVVGDEISLEKGMSKLLEFIRKDIGDKRAILPKGWDESLTDAEKSEWGLDFGEHDVEWSADQIRRYLADAYRDFGADSQERADAVMLMLEKVAHARWLKSRPMDFDRIVNWIKDTSQLRVSSATLKTQIKQLQNLGCSGGSHTEIAKALLERLEETGEVRHARGIFWRWGGSHWEPLKDTLIHETLALEFGDLPGATKAHDHRGVMQILRSLRDRELETSGVSGVNFANGFLRQDGRFVAHDPTHGATYTLPYRFLEGEGSRATRWHNFLQVTWGLDNDYQDKVNALQEIICAALLGVGPLFQRAMLMYGLAGTGKSVVLQVISGLFPDSVITNTPPDKWSDKFSITQLSKSMLNICGELPDNRRLMGATFKEVITGEPMDGQFKGQDIFKFRSKALHIFASNHLPKTSDTSEGFNRRWLIVEFNRVVPQEERVLGLGEVLLEEEREQIAAWAMEAKDRLFAAREYTLPASHIKRLSEMAEANDSVRYFFSKGRRIQFTGNPSSDRISLTKLYHEYCMFCAVVANAKPVPLQIFSHRTAELTGVFGYTVFGNLAAYGMTGEEASIGPCILATSAMV